MLRKEKVKLSDLYKLKLEEMTDILGITHERAKMLKGLASFQRVPSIGYELAYKLVHHLGYNSLNEIKDESWYEVFDSLEQKLECWTDSCVEDQIICIIHYANHPESEKQWFDFTAERKRYREQHGYPTSRPKVAWNEK
ncbi:Pathogenicity locus [Bacillus solimangrovi]|uniref:Pathogenicity locus n=2 Tax=Bacillus solimangrovi TaxID=1305675 RepID=A0A1E5LAY8_9BACI|nr:Pathogenicity locus [Bacillus solimangrovi]